MARRKDDRRKRSGRPALTVGVAWYEPGQWQQLRQVAADPEELDETYEEWLRVVDRTMKDLADAGMAPRRVPVDVDELVQWCRSQNRPVDGNARVEFVTEILRREHEQRGKAPES